MAVELVEIVNPNGRKGVVASTSTAATNYKRPPSARAQGLEPVQPGAATNPLLGTAPERPAGNASREAWIAYATHPDTPNGLSSEAAAEMSRDALVDHFDVQED